MITLRPYQEECVSSALDGLQTSTGLVVMATGLGKTVVAATVAKNFPQVLFLAHRRELLTQAVKALQSVTQRQVGLEMGAKRSRGETIIAGSVQSFPRDIPTPDLVIVDEAHHAVSSTYRKVLESYPRAKLLGITATPDRADRIALGEVFEEVFFRYETPQAIADGWLAPIFKEKVVGTEGLVAAAGTRKTIVFTPSVAEAIQVALELPRATFVHGELPSRERDSRLEAFKGGVYQYMVNCNVLTEGFDAPEIGCVCMMRATQSRACFVQCLGRGLRLAPGKEDCLYLDMVDQKEHSLEVPGHPLEGRFDNFWRRMWS